jgi:hypothetical protein
METYMFSAHFERNSLNIYRSEKCFEETLWREMKYTFYVQYTFYVCLTVFRY